ncbi:hypothetical protein LWF01_16375 [Saxibacter everestensis]|uniref:CBS domain-containing protein n=1 Tax=Saxibacter everestensis TaxID=2909229 RepID=A0ABY8QRM3_9MICO|nr:hypothetical protein LWF01_16375 [Brevibacteriaceae bacterium ZFBP1038]
MSWRRRKPPTLVLDELPDDVRRAIEAMVEGDEVAVLRGGEEVGYLSFRSAVLEGHVLPVSRLPQPETPIPEGVTVVATAMSLSGSARRRLSDEFGSDYIVLDLNEAPESTDVLLTNPISLQLIGHLRARFPQARVIISEIDDEELGVNYTGPVSRLLSAGASAYLPPRPLSGVASAVHSYLTTDAAPGLTAPAHVEAALPAPDER